MMPKLVSSGGLVTLHFAAMLCLLLYYCFLARLCELKTVL